MYEANPLFFSEPATDNPENIETTPEHIEVSKPEDIINEGDRRETVRDQDIDIHIAAAMVNPKGQDAGNEWVSIVNLGAKEVDVSGWYLCDNSDRKEPLSAGPLSLLPGESFVKRNLAVMKLGNKGDVIKLYTVNDERVDWVQYSKLRVKSGQTVKFLRSEDGIQ